MRRQDRMDVRSNRQAMHIVLCKFHPQHMQAALLSTISDLLASDTMASLVLNSAALDGSLFPR